MTIHVPEYSAVDIACVLGVGQKLVNLVLGDCNIHLKLPADWFFLRSSFPRPQMRRWYLLSCGGRWVGMFLESRVSIIDMVLIPRRGVQETKII